MLTVYFIIVAILISLSLLARRSMYTRLLSGIFLMLQVCLTIWMCYNLGKNEMSLFLIDDTAILFSFLLCLVSLATFYYSRKAFELENNRRLKSFGAGFIALVASITGVYCASNITVSWIFLEATTLSVAVLIYHNRTIRALEATWKYVFITSIGIALAYIGILFLSLTFKNSAGMDLSYANLSRILPSANPLYIKLAFLFVLIGYSAKMEIFPLYTIGIDANYVAPSPVSAFISTAMVNAGFVSIFRVYKSLAMTSVFQWAGHIMIFSGILSLIIATIYMLRVKNYKRMFAYSTLEHMGLVSIGMGIGGLALIAAILQVFLHSFVKSSMFFQLGQAHRILKTYRIGKTGNYFNINPTGALVILLGTIILVAIPPSGMFIPEWMLFTSLALSGHWILFITIAFLLCLILYGVFTRILPLLFTDVANPYSNMTQINKRESIHQFMFLLVCFAICFFRPAILTEIIGRIADLSLYY
jgi:hydrogenase-4 component F